MSTQIRTTGLEATIAELRAQLAEVTAQLVFHGHNCEAKHNEGKLGMPWGQCRCLTCAPFFQDRDSLRAELETLREETK